MAYFSMTSVDENQHFNHDLLHGAWGDHDSPEWKSLIEATKSAGVFDDQTAPGCVRLDGKIILMDRTGDIDRNEDFLSEIKRFSSTGSMVYWVFTDINDIARKNLRKYGAHFLIIAATGESITVTLEEVTYTLEEAITRMVS